jgi:uncharacterized protein YozE (UPF0346 family)
MLASHRDISPSPSPSLSRSRRGQPTIEDLERRYDKLQRKKDSDKKSFQKRVKEFELILRYLEEKIKLATGDSDVPKESELQDFINDLMERNATLGNWMSALCHRLEKFSHDFYVGKLRER